MFIFIYNTFLIFRTQKIKTNVYELIPNRIRFCTWATETLCFVPKNGLVVQKCYYLRWTILYAEIYINIPEANSFLRNYYNYWCILLNLSSPCIQIVRLIFCSFCSVTVFSDFAKQELHWPLNLRVVVFTYRFSWG